MEQVHIKDLRHGMKNVNLSFIVLDCGRTTTTKDGHEIRTCKVADRTASIQLSVWGPIGEFIQSGDILRLVKGYASIWKGALTLYVGKGGELSKTGEFCFNFNETLNMSDTQPTANQQQQTSVTSATPTTTVQQLLQPQVAASSAATPPKQDPDFVILD